VNEALVELFKHKTWATILVIEALQDVDADVLDLTTPGTYGTIRATLQHLVAADESYLATITGKPAHPLPGEPVPLEALADRIRELGPRWDALARDPGAPSREVTTGDGCARPLPSRSHRLSTTPNATAATFCPSSARTASSFPAWTSARTWIFGITASPSG
jgi:hypothetical protein